MEKLNCLMLSDSFYPIIGGRENVIDNIMRALNPKCNILLGTTTFKGHKEHIKDCNLPYKVIRCKSIRVTKNEYLSIINKNFKKQIEELIKQGKVDVIHIQTKYALMNYALKLKKKYNIPVVTTAHTNYYMQYKNQLKIPFIYNIFLNRVKKVLKKVDAVYTVSESMNNCLKKLGVYNAIIIPNGTDLKDIIVPQNFINEIKTLYNLNESTKKLIYVGRITETKNLSMLLSSLQVLKQTEPNFILFMVGGGDIKKYMMLASNLNLSENIKFVGPITDRAKLKAFYTLADLNLCPSVIESFGLTVREASATKTPSIVINGCATSEGIIDNQNGFIANNNVADFTNKILEALNHKNLKQVGENAYNTNLKTWEQIAELQINEYKKVIKNNTH